MRFLKLASAKNPDSDYVELNDFNGFLCTSFRAIGISRDLEFLPIKNRRFSVGNKPEFKNYRLTIEILTRYSEYEAKHRELITFLDRNKRSGLRLYYRPYDGMETRYCLCDIVSSEKIEKLQPVVLVVSQNSLWLTETPNKATTSQVEQAGNLFVFKEDEEIEGYYSASFSLDPETETYCISFFSGVEAKATIVNRCYNEVPLIIQINGYCVNPVVSLFRKGEEQPIRKLQILATINEGYYIEINANIIENGVWLVNSTTGERVDYSELVNNEFGSPYFYIDNGEYYITVEDDGSNVCYSDVFWQEEYSE